MCDVKFPKPHETQRQTLILSFSIAFILPNAAFVNHALAGLYPSLPTTGLKICPSPFLHHDSYTLPVLLDCFQLLLTNSSLVDSLLSLFKLLPWFRDKSASVHSSVWRKVNPQGAQRNGSSSTSLADPGCVWYLMGSPLRSKYWKNIIDHSFSTSNPKISCETVNFIICMTD